VIRRTGRFVVVDKSPPHLSGEPWELRHVDGTERTVYSGLEQRRCNQTTSRHPIERE